MHNNLINKDYQKLRHLALLSSAGNIQLMLHARFFKILGDIRLSNVLFVFDEYMRTLGMPLGKRDFFVMYLYERVSFEQNNGQREVPKRAMIC